MKIFIFTFIYIFIFSSCAPSISLVPEKYYSQEGANKVLVPGKTTEKEVKKMYGSPDYINGSNEDLTYVYRIYPSVFSRDMIMISCFFSNGILTNYGWNYRRE